MTLLARALAIAAATAAGTLTAAAAEDAFDGRWSVQMVTDSGLCDRSYSYAIAVDDGRVRYLPEPGDTPPSVSGQVAANGSVSLGIRKGIAHVNAAGRLSGTSGSGTWRLGMLGCSGRWTARKSGTLQASR